MNYEIIHSDKKDEFYTPEKCFITELLNSPSDPALSVARARVEPGVTTMLHRLKDTDKRYLILEGEGRVEIGDHPPRDVQHGDLVAIPSNETQRITNSGETDLVFLCFCTPRFEPSCYQEVEG